MVTPQTLSAERGPIYSPWTYFDFLFTWNIT